nr:hypothetical protein CFP56_08166 [Quercus suber]
MTKEGLSPLRAKMQEANRTSKKKQFLQNLSQSQSYSQPLLLLNQLRQRTSLASKFRMFSTRTQCIQRLLCSKQRHPSLRTFGFSNVDSKTLFDIGQRYTCSFL